MITIEAKSWAELRESNINALIFADFLAAVIGKPFSLRPDVYRGKRNKHVMTYMVMQ